MKYKIINGLIGLSIIILLIISVKTNNQQDTIDAFSGATPNNEVLDAIAGASTGDEHDDDDDDDDNEDDD